MIPDISRDEEIARALNEQEIEEFRLQQQEQFHHEERELVEQNLHVLIKAKQWSEVIERVKSHPHEIRLSCNDPSYKGHYTALHTLFAAHNKERISVSGEELAPVVRAMLIAADVIDNPLDNGWVDPNTMPDDTRFMSGSWRLLFDQNNHNRFTPLHLLFYDGGFIRDKAPVLKALLQMDDSVGVPTINHENRRRILAVQDRLGRNILHHFFEGRIICPQGSKCEVGHMIITINPSLLYQRDSENVTPFDCLSRFFTERFHRPYRPPIEGQIEYELFYWSVRRLEQYLRSGSNRTKFTPQNSLHAACLLPLSVSGGLLIVSLCRSTVKVNGVVLGDCKVMAQQGDSNGNLALHMFVSNKSYNNYDGKIMVDSVPAVNQQERLCRLDFDIITSLLGANPGAIRIPNNDNMLPLQIAMHAGRRYAIAKLLIEYPDAAHVVVGNSSNDTHIFLHLLSCILDNRVLKCQEDCDKRNKCLSATFELLRSRPEIFESVASRSGMLL